MARGPKRFTIYDMMEEKGVFTSNPANADSPHFKSAVQYPKMLYSPTGAERISVAAEVVMTPMGPKEYGEQRELVSRVVTSPAEERELRLAGWHDHPAKAITAGGREAPQMSPAGRIAELEAEIARLTAAKSDVLADQDELEHLKPL